MVKVSVIVPVYNAEKYIDACIASIIASTLENIEIILVDDGSTDNSYERCKSYAANDKRIKIVRQKNQGAGVARNKGLEIATGQYIGFVDSDDYIEPDMYERMYNAVINTNADIALCGVYIHNKDNDISKSYLPFKSGEVLDKKVLEDTIIPLMIAPEKEQDTKKIITRAMWCRIFKKDLIEKYSIRFTNHKNGQDTLFTLNATCKAESLIIVTDNLYHYRNNIGITLSKGYTDDVYDRLLAVRNEVVKIVDEANLLTKVQERIKQMERHDVFWVARIIVLNCNQEFFQKIKKLNNLLKRSETKKTFKNIDISTLPFQQRVLYLLLRNQLAIILYLAIRWKYRK